MQIRKIENCRLCGEPHFDEVLDLGNVASTGRFPKQDEADPPKGRLRMVVCSHCGLAQLDRDFDLAELYKAPYGYRSGINQTMRGHLLGIVSEILETTHLTDGDVVLDIASNDGTLLNAYGDQPVQRIGIDPTIAQFQDHYSPDVVAVPEFFSAERFFQASDGKKAAVITSIAMMYDLPDPHGFASDLSACLADDGIWVFEQSYNGLMLSKNAFDTICHEHLEYYGLSQIEHLLAAHGLRVFDVDFNDVNGGSFRVSACHETGPFETLPRVQSAREQEARAGLQSLATYSAFRERVMNIRESLRAFVLGEHGKGKSIYVYGASTKGNALLQYCGLDHHVIRGAADRNPEKWGHRTPGTNIPIVSEETVRSENPDYFLVLPWHFRDEFLEREQSYLRNGGKMIFPLPEFEVVSGGELS